MEINERMSKRFWLLGLVGLISAGLLVACGSSYNSSTSGLVLVGSQGSSVIQTFSFNLNSGHVASIANSINDTGNSTCLLNGLPGPMVVDPKGAYAYVILNASPPCSNSTPGILVFQIKSDGTIAKVGNLITPNSSPSLGPLTLGALAMDAAGKFLFVADRAHGNSLNQPTSPGSVSVFTIGSGGSLTEVPGSPFFTPLASRIVDITSIAATPTVFPGVGINGIQNSVCSVSQNNPPTAEFLYAVDTNNYVVWEFSVDTTTGVLGNPPSATAPRQFPTDAMPIGVAVDPCDRFVYVSGSLNNKINAYTICTVVNTNAQCPNADGSLVAVSGSPFAVTGSANGLGPIVVDPFGNDVYAVGTLSNTLSGFRISPVSGSLTALTPATVATGLQPKSIAIRADNSWLFVTNYMAGTVSQYSIAPATGALSVLPAITTDNLPFGVAVK
jgi:6-phosphogluconolactonase (cycloisomerase 2 family)